MNMVVPIVTCGLEAKALTVDPTHVQISYICSPTTAWSLEVAPPCSLVEGQQVPGQEAEVIRVLHMDIYLWVKRLDVCVCVCMCVCVCLESHL